MKASVAVSYTHLDVYKRQVVCGGSDSDVTEPRPMLGIHAAVNRAVPQCAVSVEQAIEMYTVNGAYALFEEMCIRDRVCAAPGEWRWRGRSPGRPR